MNSTVNPSPSRAALQAQIRQYVQILDLLKKKRTEVKTMNTSLKELADEILSGMINEGIPRCASSGHEFTVKEKSKMKSATARNVLVQLKEFFHLKDEEMENFMCMVDNKRKKEAEIITELECKAVKKAADQKGGDDDVIGVSPLLSKAMDDMYS